MQEVLCFQLILRFRAIVIAWSPYCYVYDIIAIRRIGYQINR
jgi:hypothetical protein